MKFHIVRNGETVKKIAFLYSLEEEEIKKENKHIRVWERLVPGTKLKIPVITEAIDEDVTQMEPFVEDYYPKLNLNEDIETKAFNHEKNISNENYVSINENINALDEDIQEIPINDEEKLVKEKVVAVDSEPLEIKQTNVNPIITKKDDSKEEEKENNVGQKAYNYYYYPYYFQYPRFVYQPQYIYPVYVYPRKLY